MEFSLANDPLEDIVAAYARDGIVVLHDVEPSIDRVLAEMLAARSGIEHERLIEAAARGPLELSPEVRARLARDETTTALEETALQALGELLVRLIGPLVHVSRTFHYQLKPKSQAEVILQGYSEGGREVEALYGVHNELTAARVLTSPNALVCWVPLNDFDGSALYYYPGSHRLGLSTGRWLERHQDCEGIERIGQPVEHRPRVGQVVLFHFLLMHGSGSAYRTPLAPGAPNPTRVSCDLRFFPFCGILDSPVHALVRDPVPWIRTRLASLRDGLLQAPLLETLAYLGEPVEWPHAEDHSCVHWARFVEGVVKGDAAQREDAVRRLVNTERGFDPLEVYLERFEQARLERRPYASLAAQGIRADEPGAGPPGP